MKSHGVSRSDRAFASGVATLHKHAEMSRVIQAGSLTESCMRDGTRPFSRGFHPAPSLAEPLESRIAPTTLMNGTTTAGFHACQPGLIRESVERFRSGT